MADTRDFLIQAGIDLNALQADLDEAKKRILASGLGNLAQLTAALNKQNQAQAQGAKQAAQAARQASSDADRLNALYSRRHAILQSFNNLQDEHVQLARVERAIATELLQQEVKRAATAKGTALSEQERNDALRQGTVLAKQHLDAAVKHEAAVSSSAQRMGIGVKQMTALRDVGGQLNKVLFGTDESFAHILGKFRSWVTASTLLYGTMRGIQGAVKLLAEVDFERTGIAKVIRGGSTAEKLQKATTLTEAAGDLGSIFGINIPDVQKQMKEFARIGLEVNEIIDATRISILLQTAANMEAADTTRVITAMTRQWGLSLADVAVQVDSLNELENNFAAETKQIAAAVVRAGAAAHAMGVDLSELNAMSTVLIETLGQTGSEVGRGLRTVFSRIFTDKSIELLRSVNIEVRDGAEAQKDATSVLAELAAKWDTLTDAKKTNLTQALAGVRQFQILDGLMRQMPKVLEAMTDQFMSMGSASEESALMLDTVSGKIKLLRGAIQEMLESGQGGLTDNFKIFLDALIGSLEQLDNFDPNVIRHIAEALTVLVGSLTGFRLAAGIGGALGVGAGVAAGVVAPWVPALVAGLGALLGLLGALAVNWGVFSDRSRDAAGAIREQAEALAQQDRYLRNVAGHAGAVEGLALMLGFAAQRTKAWAEAGKDQAEVEEDRKKLLEQIREQIDELRKSEDELGIAEKDRLSGTINLEKLRAGSLLDTAAAALEAKAAIEGKGIAELETMRVVSLAQIEEQQRLVPVARRQKAQEEIQTLRSHLQQARFAAAFSGPGSILAAGTIADLDAQLKEAQARLASVGVDQGLVSALRLQVSQIDSKIDQLSGTVSGLGPPGGDEDAAERAAKRAARAARERMGRIDVPELEKLGTSDFLEVDVPKWVEESGLTDALLGAAMAAAIRATAQALRSKGAQRQTAVDRLSDDVTKTLLPLSPESATGGFPRVTLLPGQTFGQAIKNYFDLVAEAARVEKVIAERTDEVPDRDLVSKEWLADVKGRALKLRKAMTVEQMRVVQSVEVQLEAFKALQAAVPGFAGVSFGAGQKEYEVLRALAAAVGGFGPGETVDIFGLGKEPILRGVEAARLVTKDEFQKAFAKQLEAVKSADQLIELMDAYGKFLGRPEGTEAFRSKAEGDLQRIRERLVETQDVLGEAGLGNFSDYLAGKVSAAAGALDLLWRGPWGQLMMSLGALEGMERSAREGRLAPTNDPDSVDALLGGAGPDYGIDALREALTGLTGARGHGVSPQEKNLARISSLLPLLNLDDAAMQEQMRALYIAISRQAVYENVPGMIPQADLDKAAEAVRGATGRLVELLDKQIVERAGEIVSEALGAQESEPGFEFLRAGAEGLRRFLEQTGRTDLESDLLGKLGDKYFDWAKDALKGYFEDEADLLQRLGAGALAIQRFVEFGATTFSMIPKDFSAEQQDALLKSIQGDLSGVGRLGGARAWEVLTGLLGAVNEQGVVGTDGARSGLLSAIQGGRLDALRAQLKDAEGSKNTAFIFSELSRIGGMTGRISGDEGMQVEIRQFIAEIKAKADELGEVTIREQLDARQEVFDHEMEMLEARGGQADILADSKRLDEILFLQEKFLQTVDEAAKNQIERRLEILGQQMIGRQENLQAQTDFLMGGGLLGGAVPEGLPDAFGSFVSAMSDLTQREGEGGLGQVAKGFAEVNRTVDAFRRSLTLVIDLIIARSTDLSDTDKAALRANLVASAEAGLGQFEDRAKSLSLADFLQTIQGSTEGLRQSYLQNAGMVQVPMLGKKRGDVLRALARNPFQQRVDEILYGMNLQVGAQRAERQKALLGVDPKDREDAEKTTLAKLAEWEIQLQQNTQQEIVKLYEQRFIEVRRLYKDSLADILMDLTSFGDVFKKIASGLVRDSIERFIDLVPWLGGGVNDLARSTLSLQGVNLQSALGQVGGGVGAAAGVAAAGAMAAAGMARPAGPVPVEITDANGRGLLVGSYGGGAPAAAGAAPFTGIGGHNLLAQLMTGAGIGINAAQSGNVFGGLLSGAAAGFGAGGPIGAAIGGAIGLIGSLFGGSDRGGQSERQDDPRTMPFANDLRYASPILMPGSAYFGGRAGGVSRTVSMDFQEINIVFPGVTDAAGVKEGVEDAVRAIEQAGTSGLALSLRASRRRGLVTRVSHAG